jgi:murein DD-endopeptidase MepM/ murein hydrolase activator NlpD
VVDLDHGKGVVTRYAHCGSALVSEGARVQRGVPIATVGTSGLATGPHLHYEVLVRGRQVDPLRFKIEQPGTDTVAASAPPSAPLPTPAVTGAPMGPAASPTNSTLAPQ